MIQTTPAIQREYRRAVLAWLHLTRSYHLIARQEQMLLAKFDLTLAQFDVLSHLYTDPALSQQELARRLLVTKGNICGLVDRLENAGLVMRQADPDDRRINHLVLTDAGRLAYLSASLELECTLSEQFSSLSNADVEELVRILGQLYRTVEKDERESMEEFNHESKS